MGWENKPQMSWLVITNTGFSTYTSTLALGPGLSPLPQDSPVELIKKRDQHVSDAETSMKFFLWGDLQAPSPGFHRMKRECFHQCREVFDANK